MIDNFLERHIGLSEGDIKEMCNIIGVNDLDELIEKAIIGKNLSKEEIKLPEPLTEYEYLVHIKDIATKNKVFRSFIGLGFYRTHLPSVIKRNVLENPTWYTSYTPYQAEISQGRLEALLNFQTAIVELTGLDVANASLLDEATAATEAISMMFNVSFNFYGKKNSNKVFVDSKIFPHVLSAIKTKCWNKNYELVIGNYKEINLDDSFFGAIVQYPDSYGNINDYTDFVRDAHEKKILVAVDADILALSIINPPSSFGVDIAFGTTQRLGQPLFYGGAHAAYFATKKEFIRYMPGRIIGISKDKKNRPALRMTLQTREQHIRKEKATSNICTAQALLATIASLYVMYYGKEGLQKTAWNIHFLTSTLKSELEKMGYEILNEYFFDTLTIQLNDNQIKDKIKKYSEKKQINFYYPSENQNIVRLSLDELTTLDDLNDILEVFAKALNKDFYKVEQIRKEKKIKLERQEDFLTHEIFKKYRSETELMRYIKRLEQKDIALNHSMIPLGSCTMKLNSATIMLPISFFEFANIHPFVPEEQAEGFNIIIEELGNYLKEITGFKGITFQPNSGAAGEYAGLTIMKKYFEHKKEYNRTVVFIPVSAHGTNFASCNAAGLKVVNILCREDGYIDLNDLKTKAEKYKDELLGIMITYPSTFGVFEEHIKEITRIIHENGGLVYLDGANMNALVGLVRLVDIGADLCHLNLHKTFATPHGGGGPGAGPVLVKEELIPFLPKHPLKSVGGEYGVDGFSSSPFGNTFVLIISYGYIRLMGLEGLKKATKVAILNANYLSKRLEPEFKTLFKGQNGFVAHEHIIDCRELKIKYNITEVDIAKRLMDFGFHAPTISFPLPSTLMIEPTESESKLELDRFIEAMKKIYNEIIRIDDNSNYNAQNNLLKNAPHSVYDLMSDEWNYPYSRTEAAFPLEWVKEKKFFIPVSRIDEAFGDKLLLCTKINNNVSL